VKSILIKDDVPTSFWYSNQIGKQFNIRNPRGRREIMETEGMGSYNTEDCYVVLDGEYARNIVVKEHCILQNFLI
jgi:hypothetical protein